MVRPRHGVRVMAGYSAAGGARHLYDCRCFCHTRHCPERTALLMDRLCTPTRYDGQPLERTTDDTGR